MGQSRFPQAKRLLITADAGGSNRHRTKLWKIVLRELSNDLQLNITVCHFPPGTSKWNKIEHRLFSFICQNWRGHPLYDLTTIVSLISHTTTREGVTVRCAVDDTKYEKGTSLFLGHRPGKEAATQQFIGSFRLYVSTRMLHYSSTTIIARRYFHDEKKKRYFFLFTHRNIG